jgi:hypothetical protein
VIHTVVCYEKGKFSGWPANGGVWSWGQEILVSFQTGNYRENPVSHDIDPDAPIFAAFARSRDGGATWQQEEPQLDIFAGPVRTVPPGGFDFRNPDFILRVGQPSVVIKSPLYLVSGDRGHSWEGPFAFPQFQYPLSARTCYHLEGDRQMRVFLSCILPTAGSEPFADRAFVALTRDGAQTWDFIGEMTADPARSVMPDVVRLADGTLVAAMRRRLQADNWIEVSRSLDGGASWFGRLRAGETAHAWNRNGNPPALARLQDDTLVLAYGYRGEKPSIKARISRDGGLSFRSEFILRDDARMWDIGYPRLVARPDGQCTAIYYYTTAELPEQHIAATLFSVDEAG